MQLIVGLGNPGAAYADTRHNIGFQVLDELASRLAFPPFQEEKKFVSLLSSRADAILAKPLTFMNESGRAVRALMRFYHDQDPLLVVIHDEIDLPLGEVRVSKASGSAGHKGVASVIDTLGSQEFTRIRVGIQPLEGKPKDVENFVIQRFTPLEQEHVQQVIFQAVEAVLALRSSP